MEKAMQHILWETLEKLGEAGYKNFKCKLRRYEVGDGYRKLIGPALEGDDPKEIAKIMIDLYGGYHGVEIAVNILKDMNQMQLANTLRNAMKEGGKNEELEPQSQDTLGAKDDLHQDLPQTKETSFFQNPEASGKLSVTQQEGAQALLTPKLGRKVGITQGQGAHAHKASELGEEGISSQESIEEQIPVFELVRRFNIIGQGAEFQRAPKLGDKVNVNQRQRVQTQQKPGLAGKGSVNQGQRSQIQQAQTFGQNGGASQMWGAKTHPVSAPVQKCGVTQRQEEQTQRDQEPGNVNLSQVSAQLLKCSTMRPEANKPEEEMGSITIPPTMGSPGSETMATSETSLETLRRKRQELIKSIQRDSANILDESLTQCLITEEEYDTLINTADIETRSRKLVILIQRKGEVACETFLKYLENALSEMNQVLQPQNDGLNRESEDPPTPAVEGKEVLCPGLTLAAHRVQEPKETGCARERQKACQSLESKLEMSKYRKRKLQMSDVLEISSESIGDWTPKTLKDLIWFFLRNIMVLHGGARSSSLLHHKLDDQERRVDNDDLGIGDDIFACSDIDPGLSVNPLDLICAILHCSDAFLRQEILSKMSMCQFALPLLLTALKTPECTLLLWSMRSIVKKWTPQSLAEKRGFREERLVLTQMPTISFVRLGRCSLSKSRLLNEVLSPSQQHNNFFVHKDMVSGNVPRTLADGLVEISWYFPGVRKTSDLFPEPIAVANLRGDIKTFPLQFRFLTRVSSAVFIITDCVSQAEYEFLLSLQGSTADYYFILTCRDGNTQETVESLRQLTPVLKLNRTRLLVRQRNINEVDFVRKIQSNMRDLMKASHKKMSITDMAAAACELGIQVDEDCEACQVGRKWSESITMEIRDVAKYKREMLRLQGDLWKRLAKVEKEVCRMRDQGGTAPEKYKSKLRAEQVKLRGEQHSYELTPGVITFITAVRQLPAVEKHYFLKWLKFQLDDIGRRHLSELRAQYKETCNQGGGAPQQLKELDKLISASSLGTEHFMRELGQFYEAEYSMVKEGKKAKSQRQFTHLAGIAADLMLEGFPLELIDGDASNIPLQWVTDVLTQLHTKLGRRSQMLVLTVLGVQSTGKSTLLNTMFGLQFAVSSGRCTRGAFMLLIKIRENLKQKLGCDFILVLDTEGLKAPELAELEDSYEHDNELATLVIGLSDITIVNMAMENATEMKDVLQIAVHSFLRMEQIGIKPNCQFVHQNVSEVSAYDQNMRDRKNLLEQLNEMTKAATRMENLKKELKFSDIMDYDVEKHNWYIPGLWHGDPPMASVNIAYSESLSELKKYLFEFMSKQPKKGHVKDIPQLIEWMKSLWKAVKHENFIFSFRNSLVAEAYSKLSNKYGEWEWDFRKAMHLWVSEKETCIHNQPPDVLDTSVLPRLQSEMQEKLRQEADKISRGLKLYFESGAANLHLIVKYREDFVRSIQGLRDELEHYSFSKCQEAVRIAKGQHRINAALLEYNQKVGKKVDSLLQRCMKSQGKLNSNALDEEFEKMWRAILSELLLNPLPNRDICEEMETHLRKDVENKGSAVQQILGEAQRLSAYKMGSFKMRREYLDLRRNKSWTQAVITGYKEWITQDCFRKVDAMAKSLMDKCKDYIEQKVISKADYDETFCRELLRMINEHLRHINDQNTKTSACFEIELKLHILGEAAEAFQKMHQDFIRENDPRHRLEKLKPQYLSMFKDLYFEKDGGQDRAWNFCTQCLRPALEDYVKKRLGTEIVDDFLHSKQSTKYNNRTFFQFSVLKKLLKENNFSSYVSYINDHMDFVKTRIQSKLLTHYKKQAGLKDLEERILSAITKKVNDVLKNSRGREAETVSAFLHYFCETLQEDLVIPKESFEVILFKNKESAGTFSDFLLQCIPDLKGKILGSFEKQKLKSKLSSLPVRPRDEIFKRVFGCGEQCPFCQAPCEAGGNKHREHFASIHRPQGLGRCRWRETKLLDCDICSSAVVSNRSFSCAKTKGKFHPFKDYRQFFPDWRIQPDPSVNASDYWKFVFKEFNQQFAEEYDARPADLPEDWYKITKQEALQSLQESFNEKSERG